jgi:hypothetical protein
MPLLVSALMPLLFLLMHRLRHIAVLISLGSLLVSAPAQAASFDTIAAKKAAILGAIADLQRSGKSLVGVQVNEYEIYLDCGSADWLEQMTARRPAVLGLELMNAIAVPPYRSYIVDRAAAQSAAGGLVTLTWHARMPLETCLRGEVFECVQRPMTEADFKLLLTPGTPEHAKWLADVDAMAATLKTLRERNIVVLFRPYHEMNGGWFWWGKKEAFAQLWDALYDELAVRRKLDNLIWVWSPNSGQTEASLYAPKRHKPDVVGVDVYQESSDSPEFASGRAAVKAPFPEAPFALAETGKVPSPAMLETLNPAWVLLWGGEYLNGAWSRKGECKGCNTPETLRAFLAQPRMMSLDDIPAALKAKLADGVVAPKPKPKTVCVHP